jgi:hypothetical protein
VEKVEEKQKKKKGKNWKEKSKNETAVATRGAKCSRTWAARALRSLKN